MKKMAFVFPGQGSQSVGMGKDLVETYPECAAIISETNRILGYDLWQIMQEGSIEELSKTQHAQAAIFSVSIMLFRLLKQKDIQACFYAGHSLGEITAYVAAGVLSFEEGLRLIQVRGRAMAEASPEGLAGMAAIMGASLERIQSVLSQVDQVVVANFNCPGQIVISGLSSELSKALLLFKEEGAKAIPLKVSGAFHSPFMKKASETLKQHCASLSFVDADFPIVLNRNASPEKNALALQANLAEQVISPVRWIDTLEALDSQVDAIVEVGPGKVLSGLVKRTLPEKAIFNVSSTESLSLFLSY